MPANCLETVVAAMYPGSDLGLIALQGHAPSPVPDGCGSGPHTAAELIPGRESYYRREKRRAFAEGGAPCSGAAGPGLRRLRFWAARCSPILRFGHSGPALPDRILPA